jgi:hypothetical protein
MDPRLALAGRMGLELAAAATGGGRGCDEGEDDGIPRGRGGGGMAVESRREAIESLRGVEKDSPRVPEAFEVDDCWWW